jgi:hypothetical protein
MCRRSAEVAQLVERQLPKLKVAGSNLVFRSKLAKVSAQRLNLCFLIWIHRASNGKAFI